VSIQIALSSDAATQGRLGGGLNLMARNILRADDVHVDGLYWLRPYDMMQFGDAGAAAMAASGFRYAWLFSSDHYDQHGWRNSGGIHLGWSNDVAIPPRHSQQIIVDGFTLEGHTYAQLETPLLVHDPVEDGFMLYAHAVNTSATRQNTVLLTSPDLYAWTMVGVSHRADQFGHAGYQLVHREAADSWWSQGLSGVGNSSGGYWTSTDGRTFTLDTNLGSGLTGDGLFAAGSGAMALYDIAAQRYMLGFSDDGQRRIINIPISDSCELPETSDDIVNISTGFGSIVDSYPGPKYLQGVDVAIEDGIAHIFPKRGFFADNGLTGGAAYGAGGGYDDQICDYYRYIIDETAARASAPAGVRASADGGVVTLNWYNALPQNTYRVYRDTDPALGTKTLVGNVTGIQTTDTPGGAGRYYYQVVTLDGSDEEGARIVSPYVSSRSSLVNEHVTRVLALGGDIGTIDLDHLEWAEDVLDELDLRNHLAFWVMPEFGHIKNESNVLSKIFCLGTTLKPRGGDLTFATGNTTYSATAWNSLPGWTASTGAAQGYFGGSRLNNIRRAGGLTMIGSVQKSHTGAVSLFGWGEFSSTTNLGLSSGSPASVVLNSGGSTDTHGTTVANSDDHIIGAVLSSTCKVFVEGVGGTGFSANTGSALALSGQKGMAEFDAYFWATGSSSAKYRVSPGRSFTNSGQFASRHAIFFTTALNDTQMATLNTRLRDGP
jgi:hypothetical protein